MLILSWEQKYSFHSVKNHRNFCKRDFIVKCLSYEKIHFHSFQVVFRRHSVLVPEVSCDLTISNPFIVDFWSINVTLHFSNILEIVRLFRLVIIADIPYVEFE